MQASRPKKILTVVGARPQFIKAFALSRAMADMPELEEVIVHTGQHFDRNMSDVFFEELGIPQPRYHFAVGATHHGAATAQMLMDIESALQAEKPDAAIVYGDTNSTLAGALAAAKLHVPLVHIEAGMRSFNRRMPEEINRIVVDHVSDLLLCSTQTAVNNLAREGISQDVHLVGDLMYDATIAATEVAERRSGILEQLRLEPKGYGVATIHRAENTDDAAQLARVLEFIAEQALSVPVIFPVHPRTRSAAAASGFSLHRSGLFPVDPIGYLDMCRLTRHAAFVLTDSGGLQKEAYFHRVPCITLRSETEWPETVECGWNRLWTEADFRPRREIQGLGQNLAAPLATSLLQSKLESRMNP